MQRRGRFYRNNERDIMQCLGFEPTKGSGAGWIEKEDGQNDMLIAQLKSTDALQIAVRKIDLDRLVQNAAVTHKLPVFVVEFLETGDLWLMVRPEDIRGIADNLEVDNQAPIEFSTVGAQAVSQANALTEAIANAAKAMVGANGITSAAMDRTAFEQEQLARFDKTKYIGGKNGQDG